MKEVACGEKSRMITKKIILIISLIIVTASAMPVKAQTLLTKEEQDYINKGNRIEAVSLHGGAPLQYADANGRIKGISKEVLEEIAHMTGLVFECQLYDTFDEVLNSAADIIIGIPYNYATENMVMSLPFLKSETILYINSSVDPNELEDMKYAATEGSNIPEGIKEENAIYFKPEKRVWMQ